MQKVRLIFPVLSRMDQLKSQQPFYKELHNESDSHEAQRRIKQLKQLGYLNSTDIC